MLNIVLVNLPHSRHLRFPLRRSLPIISPYADALICDAIHSVLFRPFNTSAKSVTRVELCYLFSRIRCPPTYRITIWARHTANVFVRRRIDYLTQTRCVYVGAVVKRFYPPTVCRTHIMLSSVGRQILSSIPNAQASKFTLRHISQSQSVIGNWCPCCRLLQWTAIELGVIRVAMPLGAHGKGA